MSRDGSLVDVSFVRIGRVRGQRVLRTCVGCRLKVAKRTIDAVMQEFMYVEGFVRLLRRRGVLTVRTAITRMGGCTSNLQRQKVRTGKFGREVFNVNRFCGFVRIGRCVAEVPFQVRCFRRGRMVMRRSHDIRRAMCVRVLGGLCLFPRQLQYVFLRL